MRARGVLEVSEGSRPVQERPPNSSISERKHRFVQTEINETALKLFVERGFDQTTVDEIAQAAGISRRTFFRYFDTKEDVVVTALAGSGQFLMELIFQQPSDVDPMTAMHQSMREFLAHYQSQDPHAWQVLHLIQSTPKLRARFLYERDRWLPRMTEILATRSVPLGRAEMAATTALGILAVVYDRWHADQSLDVARAVDEAFEELAWLVSEKPRTP